MRPCYLLQKLEGKRIVILNMYVFVCVDIDMHVSVLVSSYNLGTVTSVLRENYKRYHWIGSVIEAIEETDTL